MVRARWQHCAWLVAPAGLAVSAALPLCHLQSAAVPCNFLIEWLCIVLQFPGWGYIFSTFNVFIWPANSAHPAVLPLGAAVPWLLAQRDAFSNWAEFSAGHKIAGWDETTPLCNWGCITCYGPTDEGGTYDL